MADPTSKVQIDLLKQGDEGDESGHRDHATTREIATIWALVEQINNLRALHGLSPITVEQARNEVVRLTRVIDNLPVGS